MTRKCKRSTGESGWWMRYTLQEARNNTWCAGKWLHIINSRIDAAAMHWWCVPRNEEKYCVQELVCVVAKKYGGNSFGIKNQCSRPIVSLLLRSGYWNVKIPWNFRRNTHKSTNKIEKFNWRVLFTNQHLCNYLPKRYTAIKDSCNLSQTYLLKITNALWKTFHFVTVQNKILQLQEKKKPSYCQRYYIGKVVSTENKLL